MMRVKWLYLLVCAALVSVALTGRAREVCLSGYSGFCSKGITDGAVVDFSGLSLDHDASLAYDRRESVMRETLRGVAGIRRDFVVDSLGLRLKMMETRGRFLQFSEPMPVTVCAKEISLKGEGRHFISEAFDFSGEASVSISTNRRLIFGPGDTINNVVERKITITGVRCSADSLLTPVSLSTSYYYSYYSQMPIAVVDCSETQPSGDSEVNAVAYLFPPQEDATEEQKKNKSPKNRNTDDTLGMGVTGQTEIVICDTMGRIVCHTTSDDSGGYNMPDLTPGYYVLTTISADGSSESRTIYVSK